MMKQLYSTTKFILTHPLIKKNKKWDSLVNFIFWQIGARTLSKKVVVPWVEDSKLIIGVGENGATGNIYTGFAEFQDMFFYCTLFGQKRYLLILAQTLVSIQFSLQKLLVQIVFLLSQSKMRLIGWRIR